MLVDVQAKIAKLRREILEPPKSGGAGKGEGFDVTKVMIKMMCIW